MADGIALRFNNVAYSAADERLLSAAGLAPQGSTTARAGVRPGPGGAVSVSGSPESVTVTPFLGVITDPDGGSYRVAITNSVTRTMPARPATGTSAVHELVAVIKDSDVRPGDAVREVQVQLITGNSAANPVAPAIPDGALRLRTLNVPSSGSVALSNPARFSVASGGILPVYSQAERDALPMGIDVVRRLDLDGILQRRGVANTSAWFEMTPAVTVPALSLVATSAQNMTDQQQTTLLWGTSPEVDTGDFTVATGVVTVKVAGVYDIAFGGSVVGTSSPGGRRTIALMKNSSVALRRLSWTPYTVTTTADGSVRHRLAANDTISVQQFQSSGGTLATDVTSGYAPRLSLSRVTA